jgi:signal peptidase
MSATLVGLALLFGAIAFFVLIGPRFGYTYAVVKSGSMEPAFKPGSVIVLDAVPPDWVGLGDVISFTAPGRNQDEIVTHRVVAIFNDAGRLRFQTKGDANEEADGRLVESSAVRGRVVLNLPLVGKLAPIAQKEGLFFGVVLVCGSLLIVMEAANIFRELRGSQTPRAG